MKKIILAIVLVIPLSGCGAFDRATAVATGFSRMCVDGVSYIQFTSGATVAYNTNGTVKTCN